MKARTYIAILLNLAMVVAALLAPAVSQAAFGLQSFSVTATDREGNPDFQAGSHPYKYTITFRINQIGEQVEGVLRDLNVELPPGLVGNPRAVPKCLSSKFDAATPQCPIESQIGVARVELSGGLSSLMLPVYNRVPPLGYAASLGFSLFGSNSFQEASVRTGEDYGLSVADFTIPVEDEVNGIKETIWGVPADPGHDSERGEAAYDNTTPSPTDAPPRPFLTLPPSCTGPLTTTISVDSLENPGVFDSRAVQTTTGLDGCNKLEFEPTVSAQPTTNLSDSPTGLDFNIHQPAAPETEPQSLGFYFCGPGSWSGEPPTYSYQWLRNGSPIAGATSNRYEVQAADAGKALQCEVIAGSTYGSAVSSSYRHVDPPNPAGEIPSLNSPRPNREKIVEGSKATFSCEPENWTGEPSFSYQWYSEGAPIAGATNRTFEVNTSEEPATVQCRVKGENSYGASVAFSEHEVTYEQTPEPGPPEYQLLPEVYVPNKESPLAPSTLQNVSVKLPAGMSLNPSAGNGLGGCDEQQVGYQPKGGKVRFSESPQNCPDSAKLGTFSVTTPVLDHDLKGGVYLAKPYENPFGSLLALYLTVEDEQSGIYAKLAGKVDADPSTGQLTATFMENPNLPLEDITLHLFNGRRAALTTPLACGLSTTTSDLAPWSAPEGADAHPSDSFATSVAASGSGPCPTSEATAPNTPSFSAGTAAPQAGSFSPFLLRLVRANGTQHITAIDTTLPAGLVGKLAGIPYCPETGIAQAIAREASEQGKAEQAAPSCPQASEVGAVQVTAGSGITPIPVSGHAYLAGPYKGAPLSLVTIVPAVAGPFDLGNVVTRIALNVDPYSAQIKAVSDPLPTIIQGIPLDIRSIALRLDRPGFTLNPTSCEAKAITGSVTTQAGQSAALNNRFQVGECKRLAFKPKLKLSLKGSTQRGKNPALKAVLTQPAGQADIGNVAVTLPKSEFIDNRHINNPCTRVEFNAGAGNGAQCPAKSILGYAKAYTPLLDRPLEGPVYFRSNGGERELPDLVASLGGQVHLNVVGFIDSVGKKGSEVSRVRNTFAAVPDAPVSRFVLELKGGKKGLLQNSANLCKVENVAAVKFGGQNGKLAELSPTIANQCGKKKGKKGSGAKHKGKKHSG